MGTSLVMVVAQSMSLNLPSIPCMLKLMTCSTRPRTLKRRPKRPWLMLPALLMSLELSKSMPLLKKRPSALLSLKLLSLNNAWLKLMRLLPRVDVLPWLNLSLASGSWKLSLAAAKAKLVRPSRDSKRLSAVSRSSNSNKMKITRIKIACLNLLASFNKRSRLTRNRLEAEEIAALNLAKYRKAQQELEEAEERSKLAGNALSVA